MNIDRYFHKKECFQNPVQVLKKLIDDEKLKTTIESPINVKNGM